jgi:homogentisate 1,2-dioxygenase
MPDGPGVRGGGTGSVLAPAAAGETEVLVRHAGGGTRYLFSHHPFDVVGWDGCLYPYAFNIADFEPMVGRVHLPPPVHQTFEGPGFVVCSFCPRPFDFDPAAVPAPYNHANVDSDEVLFYVGGDFMSRRGAGIEVGSLTLHPAGFVHGPQPGSVEASLGQPGTEEWAVMIDTFRPLQLGPGAVAAEDPGYAWTWSGSHQAETPSH